MNNKMDILDSKVRDLFDKASQFKDSLLSSKEKEEESIGQYVERSVVFPLRNILKIKESSNTQISTNLGDKIQLANKNVSKEIDTKTWELALEATILLNELGNPAELIEATAALQYVAIAIVGEPLKSERAKDFRAEQSKPDQKILLAENGPYLVTNIQSLNNYLGETVLTGPTIALCRCGASDNKPFCDGSHTTSGFIGSKDSKRVPDSQDTHVGQQVTVLDNRGICQHSGFCTDRISTVFRLATEPFIAPSGGRMDEIIRAVRDCPSGALSYAIDGVEARNQVDYHNKRDPKIGVSKDGPYRITGGIPIVDCDNTPVERNKGASLEHYALCRCGKSQNKPFCSGMHWYVDFKDPLTNENEEPTIFEWAGGQPALIRMTRLFYEKYVPEDPLLAPLFASMSADHANRVAKWLAEVFCGPQDYSKEYGGYKRMLVEHMGKCLTDAQRERWVGLLLKASKEAGLPNDAEFRSAFSSYIEWGSRLAVENSQTDSKPPENMPMPHWDWNTAAGRPSSRISALEVKVPEQEYLIPAPDEILSFEEHVRPLFRKRDQQSMSFVFDLWSYSDVEKYGAMILSRVEDGTMPCDGKWPENKIEIFRRWLESGMKE